jgi:DNA-binding transcriptional ArsR family regulator
MTYAPDMNQERIHKLTSAVYRVTERLNDSEPLKWRLRDTALLISDICDQKDYLEEERNKRIAQALSDIIRFLDLAALTFYIARANFETLSREYMHAGASLELESGRVQKKEEVSIIEKQSAPTSRTPSNRQEEILKFLRLERNASIGDIVNSLGNSVSEKTVQRDLARLITQGIVAAVGDKRWRRYSIGQ